MAKKLICILVIALAALAACTPSRVADALEHADQIIEADPDSAFALLQSIDTAQLKSQCARAHYALLSTQAAFKLKLPRDCTSEISFAVEYYRHQGNKDNFNLLRALYYEGMILLRGNDYYKSMSCALPAFELAQKYGDSLWIARTAELLADIFSFTYNYQEAKLYETIAVENYNNTPRHDNYLWSLCDLALIDGTIGDFDKAITLLDSVRNAALSLEQIDTMLLAINYRYDCLLRYNMQDYNGALNCFDSLANFQNAYSFSCEELNRLAQICAYHGDFDNAEYYIANAIPMVENNSDRANVFLSRSVLAEAKGDYSSARDYLDSVLITQNDEILEILRQSATSAQRDYYKAVSAAREQKARSLRHWLVALIIFTATTCAIGMAIYKHRMRLKDLEIDKKMLQSLSLMRDIEDLTLEVEKRKSRETALDSDIGMLKAEIENLFRSQWEMANLLCKQYLSADSGDKKQRAEIARHLEIEIQKIKDKKHIKKIREAVDCHIGNIISRLQLQCSDLDDDDLDFLALCIAGFSSYAIAYIYDKSQQYAYKRRTRLVSRIQLSDAPDKDAFIAKITSKP